MKVAQVLAAQQEQRRKHLVLSEYLSSQQSQPRSVERNQKTGPGGGTSDSNRNGAAKRTVPSAKPLCRSQRQALATVRRLHPAAMLLVAGGQERGRGQGRAQGAGARSSAALRGPRTKLQKLLPWWSMPTLEARRMQDAHDKACGERNTEASGNSSIGAAVSQGTEGITRTDISQLQRTQQQQMSQEQHQRQAQQQQRQLCRASNVATTGTFKGISPNDLGRRNGVDLAPYSNFHDVDQLLQRERTIFEKAMLYDAQADMIASLLRRQAQEVQVQQQEQQAARLPPTHAHSLRVEAACGSGNNSGGGIGSSNGGAGSGTVGGGGCGSSAVRATGLKEPAQPPVGQSSTFRLKDAELVIVSDIDSMDSQLMDAGQRRSWLTREVAAMNEAADLVRSLHDTMMVKGDLRVRWEKLSRCYALAWRQEWESLRESMENRGWRCHIWDMEQHFQTLCLKQLHAEILGLRPAIAPELQDVRPGSTAATWRLLLQQAALVGSPGAASPNALMILQLAVAGFFLLSASSIVVEKELPNAFACALMVCYYFYEQIKVNQIADFKGPSPSAVYDILCNGPHVPSAPAIRSPEEPPLTPLFSPRRAEHVLCVLPFASLSLLTSTHLLKGIRQGQPESILRNLAEEYLVCRRLELSRAVSMTSCSFPGCGEAERADTGAASGASDGAGGRGLGAGDVLDPWGSHLMFVMQNLGLELWSEGRTGREARGRMSAGEGLSTAGAAAGAYPGGAVAAAVLAPPAVVQPTQRQQQQQRQPSVALAHQEQEEQPPPEQLAQPQSQARGQLPSPPVLQRQREGNMMGEGEATAPRADCREVEWEAKVNVQLAWSLDGDSGWARATAAPRTAAGEREPILVTTGQPLGDEGENRGHVLYDCLWRPEPPDELEYLEGGGDYRKEWARTLNEYGLLDAAEHDSTTVDAVLVALRTGKEILDRRKSARPPYDSDFLPWLQSVQQRACNRRRSRDMQYISSKNWRAGMERATPFLDRLMGCHAERLPAAWYVRAVSELQPGLLREHEETWGELVRLVRSEQRNLRRLLEVLHFATLGVAILATQEAVPSSRLRLALCAATGLVYAVSWEELLTGDSDQQVPFPVEIVRAVDCFHILDALPPFLDIQPDPGWTRFPPIGSQETSSLAGLPRREPHRQEHLLRGILHSLTIAMSEVGEVASALAEYVRLATAASSGGGSGAPNAGPSVRRRDERTERLLQELAEEVAVLSGIFQESIDMEGSSTGDANECDECEYGHWYGYGGHGEVGSGVEHNEWEEEKDDDNGGCGSVGAYGGGGGGVVVGSPHRPRQAGAAWVSGGGAAAAPAASPSTAPAELRLGGPDYNPSSLATCLLPLFEFFASSDPAAIAVAPRQKGPQPPPLLLVGPEAAVLGLMVLNALRRGEANGTPERYAVFRLSPSDSHTAGVPGRHPTGQAATASQPPAQAAAVRLSSIRIASPPNRKMHAFKHRYDWELLSKTSSRFIIRANSSWSEHLRLLQRVLLKERLGLMWIFGHGVEGIHRALLMLAKVEQDMRGLGRSAYVCVTRVYTEASEAKDMKTGADNGNGNRELIAAMDTVATWVSANLQSQELKLTFEHVGCRIEPGATAAAICNMLLSQSVWGPVAELLKALSLRQKKLRQEVCVELLVVEADQQCQPVLPLSEAEASRRQVQAALMKG